MWLLQAARSKQKVLIAPAPLTVKGVLKALRSLSQDKVRLCRQGEAVASTVGLQWLGGGLTWFAVHQLPA